MVGISLAPFFTEEKWSLVERSIANSKESLISNQAILLNGFPTGSWAAFALLVLLLRTHLWVVLHSSIQLQSLLQWTASLKTSRRCTTSELMSTNTQRRAWIYKNLMKPSPAYKILFPNTSNIKKCPLMTTRKKRMTARVCSKRLQWCPHTGTLQPGPLQESVKWVAHLRSEVPSHIIIVVNIIFFRKRYK